MLSRIALASSAFLLLGSSAQAGREEYLVRFKQADRSSQMSFLQRNGGALTAVSKEGLLYQWTSDQSTDLSWDKNIAYVQKNHTYHIFLSPALQEKKAELLKGLSQLPSQTSRATDNPEIPNPGIQATGADTMLDKAWGITKVGADIAWKNAEQGKGIVVAVTDSGVDYTHPDLVNNLWRNKGEIPGDGIDNDKNGYVDDIVGWDFAANDNKPFDLTLSLLDIILSGGNPGHGTHVSGVVGARLNNGQGVAGVAPLVKIMCLRFITEKGQGDTTNAVRAIDYAVANGASIINASWGGEKGSEDDSALIEAITRAKNKGVIFVAAAGNGRTDSTTMTSAGFDNDNDAKPMVPASYDIENIVSVAALDDQDQLAKFSNWGHKSVKLGAPGVKILSTVPGNRYQDTIIELGTTKVTWDGTSMAAPFVAGALAVVWSENQTQTAAEVINTLLTKVTPASALKSKVATEGRLEMRAVRD